MARSTPEAIEEAVRDGLGVVVTPISFVSEHIETLVELDHDYAELAKAVGSPAYVRVPALGVDGGFIEALVEMVKAALDRPKTVGAGAPAGEWRCGADWKHCPARKETAA